MGIPVYEPDGQQGPDFVINELIAVETTLLQQSFSSEEGDTIPINQKYPAIRDSFLKILRSFDNDYSGLSYFINFEYTGKLIRIYPSMAKKITTQLKEYLAGNRDCPHSFSVNDKITISINPARQLAGSVF